MNFTDGHLLANSLGLDCKVNQPSVTQAGAMRECFVFLTTEAESHAAFRVLRSMILATNHL